MLRIYCDSNVYRYLKPGHPSYSHDLLELFEALKDKMIFTFSDAHLDDLKDSIREYAVEDLELMGRYTRDNYFMHDLVKEKRTSPYLATPLEAFNGKDYKAYNAILQGNPFDLDKMFPDDPDDEFGFNKLIRESMKTLYNMPIGALAPVDTANMQGTHKEWFEKIVPDYHPVMSMGDMMNSVWPFSKALLENSKEMTSLRRYIGEYLNRDEYSFDKFGMGFNERLKDTAIGKTFTELLDSILTDNDKKDPYQKFNRIYTFLELYNITQEKKGSSNKLKQFDFQSLNNDALHAWYASFSDYLVTDDKGLQVKAAICYQLLGLPTKILSSQDFLNMKTILLGQEETMTTLTDGLLYDIEHAMLLYNHNTADAVVNTYKSGHPYFNYANRFQIVQGSRDSEIVLYCDRQSHADFFMYREMETLVDKMIALLGMDDQGKGTFGIGKKDEIDWDHPLRTWSLGNRRFSIGLSEKAPSFIYIRLWFPKKS